MTDANDFRPRVTATLEGLGLELPEEAVAGLCEHMYAETADARSRYEAAYQRYVELKKRLEERWQMPGDGAWSLYVELTGSDGETSVRRMLVRDPELSQGRRGPAEVLMSVGQDVLADVVSHAITSSGGRL